MSARENAERLANAQSTLGVLFPGADVRLRRRPPRDADPRRVFAVAPSLRHARLLVPYGPAGAAATAMSSYGGRLSPAATWTYRAAGTTLRVTGGRGPGPRFVVSPQGPSPQPGIDDHLSVLLGTPVSIAVHLTPARANRKPILQALAGGQRRPNAFVKVGTNPLTSMLVTHEAAALRRLAAANLTLVTVPAVIGCDDFGGHAVLTLEPLPTWLAGGRLPERGELIRAAESVATVSRGSDGPLAQSGLWDRLHATLTAIPTTPLAMRLQRAHELLGQRAAHVELATGASHGDWSPWNMRFVQKRLHVWDWERFALDVPIGSDLIHYRLQELIVMRGQQPSDAARMVVADAPQILRGVVDDSSAAHVIAVAHLLALATRYESESAATAGGQTARLQDQLMTPIEAGIPQVDHSPRSHA